MLWVANASINSALSNPLSKELIKMYKKSPDEPGFLDLSVRSDN